MRQVDTLLVMLPGLAMPPFVGRNRELDALRAAVCAAPVRGALIAGPAGVGKTRLAQEVATYAEAAGRQVLAARSSGSGLHLPLAALVRLLPAEEPATLLNPVQRGLRGLRQLAEKAPILLLADDAHLLDEVSATVIHQLVADRTVALLATLRTGEPVPGAVTALWKDLDVLRVDLDALSAHDADALITETLGGPVEGQTLRRLREVADGNALFLHEMLRSAWESGLLTYSAGIWRLTGRLCVTARLTELLHDRLSTADAAERDALEVVAIGEPVPLDVVRRLVHGELLEALERRGLIAVSGEDSPLVRLAHPLYGELLRAEVPLLARLRHTRRLADAQEEIGVHRDADVLRVAMWRLDAGGEINPDLMLAAARQAALIRQYELVERLAARAYQAGAGIPAGLTMMGALFQLGRLAEALRWCAELTAEATSDAERAQVALAHASVLTHGADDLDRAHAVLNAVTVTEPQWQTQLDVTRLYLRSYELDGSGVDAAQSIFGGAGSVSVRLGAASAAGGALMLAGRYTEIIPLIEQAVPLAAGYDGPGRLLADSMPSATAWMRANLLDLPGALVDAETSYRESLHPPDRVAQAVSAFTLGRITLMLGRPVTASRWAAEAFLVSGQVQLRGVRRWAAGLRLQAAAQAEAEADLAAAAADLAAAESDERRARLFDIEVARGRAWHAAVVGDQARVRESLGAEVVRHGERGAVGAGTLGALDLIRLGEAELAAELLTRFPPPPDWALGQLIVEYAAAGAAGDAGNLLAIARRFARHDMPLYAAEAATLAAAVWRRSGESRPAARARLFTEVQLARCEPVETPALCADRTVELTSREREVVLAATSGESDRAIAKRLHISQRTVENHLHRAYAKLGVAGRSGLRSALGLD